MKRIGYALGILATLIVAACTDVLVGSQPETTPAAIFDTIWGDVDRYYSFFDIDGVDWNAAAARYRPVAIAATSDAQLAGVIGQMFAELHDEHVDLFVPPDTYYRSVDFSAIHTYFNPLSILEYVPSLRSTHSTYMAYGMAGPNIGYVWIATFGGSGWTDEIDVALKAMPSARGVVIDVRNNGGGASDNADAIAGRFEDSTRIIGYDRVRDGPSHTDFTGLFPVRVSPGGAVRFAGPIIVLTNRGVASASEHFVLAMRARPMTTVIGDTTAGAMGNPIVRELANGWSYRIPQAQEFGPNKELYEGIGIAPTTVVHLAASDSAAQRDPQIAAAIAALNYVNLDRTRHRRPPQ